MKSDGRRTTSDSDLSPFFFALQPRSLSFVLLLTVEGDALVSRFLWCGCFEVQREETGERERK